MTFKYRDAKTGHYTTKRDAERRPANTVRERDKPKPPSKPKK